MGQPEGADRTGLGHPGFALKIVVCAPTGPAGTMAPGSKTKEEAVAKVEKGCADNGKPQYLQI
jgi:hypothetical protein